MRKVQAAHNLYEAVQLLNIRLDEAYKLGLKVEMQLLQADKLAYVKGKEVESATIIQAALTSFDPMDQPGWGK